MTYFNSGRRRRLWLECTRIERRLLRQPWRCAGHGVCSRTGVLPQYELNLKCPMGECMKIDLAHVEEQSACRSNGALAIAIHLECTEAYIRMMTSQGLQHFALLVSYICILSLINSDISSLTSHVDEHNSHSPPKIRNNALTNRV